MRHMGKKSDYKGNYKGRTDYGGRRGGSVENQAAKGDKGIPPGMPGSNEPPTKKGVAVQAEVGDKGIPPMGAKPKAKAPLD